MVFITWRQGAVEDLDPASFASTATAAGKLDALGKEHVL
jgi:hypothetical protein